MSVQILNRIFKRNNMIRILPVHNIHQRCQCCGLTASGWPCHQYKASLLSCQCLYFRRYSKTVCIRYGKWQTTHGRSQSTALLINIDTESSDSRNGISHVRLSICLQLVSMTIVQNQQPQCFQICWLQLVAFKWCQYTVNTIIRRTPCCKMNI